MSFQRGSPQPAKNVAGGESKSETLSPMTSLPMWLTPPQIGSGVPPATRSALGPLAEMVDDPRVTDVFVTSSGDVFVDTGEGAHVAPGLVLPPPEARELARHLIEQGGRHVDEATPLVDVNLTGGLRVHVALWPIARAGAEISVRIHRHHKPQLERLSLENAEAVTPVLVDAVENKKTLLITGATGSGKTTLLGALMAFATPTERLVVLEDVAELSIDHPHVVSLECRQPNIEGVGEVTLTRLVREALRMRPDRLIVGECRGAEWADLLRAFMTGHQGGATTLHATSLADVPLRIDSLASLANLTSRQAALHTASAIDLVIHVDNLPGGARHLSFGVPFVNKEGALRVLPVEEMASQASIAPR